MAESAEKADLKFGVSSEFSGFNTVSVTLGGRSKGAIVRELLQNSLDAVRSIEPNKQAHVKFKIEAPSLDTVPGIGSYRKALADAIATQTAEEDLQLTAKNIVDGIQEVLDSTTCPTLYVMDNGIGLDNKRMHSLLSDGLSAKYGDAGGSHGVGHTTAFQLSDLRYCLYGSIDSSGHRLRAGHAILATHETDDGMLSKDGYFIAKFRKGRGVGRNRFEFANQNDSWPYLDDEINWMQREWGSGTVVAIPGYNRFGSPKSALWEIVSEAAFCSFFVAIKSSQLKITVEEDGNVKSLDASNIDRVAGKFKSNKYRRGDQGFPAGAHAHSALRVFSYGQEEIVKVLGEQITLKFICADNLTTKRVDLCRNGMWITDKLPKLSIAKFGSDKQRFHCVVLLDPYSKEVSSVIRAAETPLHNALDLSVIKSTQMHEKYAQIVTAISDKLAEVLPKLNSSGFRYNHGLAADNRNGHITGGFKEIRKRDDSGTGPEPAPGRNSDSDPTTNTSNTKSDSGNSLPWDKQFNRSGELIPFVPASRPVGLRGYQIEITPGESQEMAEIRFQIDESVDESCLNTNKPSRHVRLKEVKVNGQPVSASHLIPDSAGDVKSVKLNNLKEGESLMMTFEYDLDPELPVNTHIALVPKLVRRAKPVKSHEAES